MASTKIQEDNDRRSDSIGSENATRRESNGRHADDANLNTLGSSSFLTFTSLKF